MIDAGNYKHAGITKEIIGAYYNVYKSLGYGFLEKVYENAMLIELKNRGYNQDIIDLWKKID